MSFGSFRPAFERRPRRLLAELQPAMVVDGDFGPRPRPKSRVRSRWAASPRIAIVGLQTWALPVHAAGQVLADLCGVTGPGSH